MEYLFVCSTIDIQMKNHLHCYRYQRLKYKFNYTSLVKFVYFTHRCVTEKMGNFDERLCLQWNNFRKNISSTFGDLREDKEFTDVTMACQDGQQVKAHKVVLIASSPFFLNILRFIITFMRLPSSRRELLSELTKTEKSHKQERMN